MSLRDEAERYADRVFDTIAELAILGMQQRRDSACWHKVKCERRLKTCAWGMRRWWQWRVNVHDGRCFANEQMRAKITAACECVANEMAA
jgi:hypothetical protein